MKLQAFPCGLFTSQPTPFFGAWRSTSGRSLCGMWPRWRAIKAISGSHSAAVLASVTAFMSVRQQLNIPQANSHQPAVLSVGIICSNDPGAGEQHQGQHNHSEDRRRECRGLSIRSRCIAETADCSLALVQQYCSNAREPDLIADAERVLAEVAS